MTTEWFAEPLPTTAPVAHLLAAHQPDIRSRITRCGITSRTWRRLADLLADGREWTRCPSCAATLTPPRRRRPAPRRPEIGDAAAAVVAAYDAALAAADLAAGTRRIYTSRLRSFLAFLDTADLDLDGRDPLADPHGRNYAVREFRTHLKTVKGLKPATINNYIAALDHFFAYHLDLGRAVIDRECLPRWAPKALEPVQRKKFLRAVERCDSVRDRAICHTFYFSGLRVAELAALDLRDLTRSARRAKLVVRDGKGNIYREIPGLHRIARDSLNDWLDQRPQWLGNNTGETALFVGRRGRRLSDRMLREIVVAVGADAGLGEVDGEAFGPHILRHTLATMRREQGYSLPVIAAILGHASVETTGRYTLASENEAAEALENLAIGT